MYIMNNNSGTVICITVPAAVRVGAGFSLAECRGQALWYIYIYICSHIVYIHILYIYMYIYIYIHRERERDASLYIYIYIYMYIHINNNDTNNILYYIINRLIWIGAGFSSWPECRGQARLVEPRVPAVVLQSAYDTLLEEYTYTHIHIYT